MLLIQKRDEKEEFLLEKYTDKKVLVEQEWVQTDHQLEKRGELYLVLKIIETLHFL
jgi:hypothetical protein